MCLSMQISSLRGSSSLLECLSPRASPALCSSAKAKEAFPQLYGQPLSDSFYEKIVSELS